MTDRTLFGSLRSARDLSHTTALWRLGPVEGDDEQPAFLLERDLTHPRPPPPTHVGPHNLPVPNNDTSAYSLAFAARMRLHGVYR